MSDRLPSQSIRPERVQTEQRWRIAVERVTRLGHLWTVEEYSATLGWRVRANGRATTRRGAVRAARRHTLRFPVFRVDRYEELIVSHESYVPSRDQEPAVRATLEAA